MYMLTVPTAADGGTDGQVQMKLGVKTESFRFRGVSDGHQALLITGITKAVVDMLKADDLHDHHHFNIANFHFDVSRYQYNYLMI